MMMMMMAGVIGRERETGERNKFSLPPKSVRKNKSLCRKTSASLFLFALIKFVCLSFLTVAHEFFFGGGILVSGGTFFWMYDIKQERRK
jgi:hypothetical protein